MQKLNKKEPTGIRHKGELGTLSLSDSIGSFYQFFTFLSTIAERAGM